MIRWALWRLLAFFIARYELIRAPDGSKYLSRWHFPAWYARYCGSTFLFLHWFHASDSDRGWHNHPWVWCESLILRGAYLQAIAYHWRGEWRAARRTFRAGQRNIMFGEYHSVTLLRRPVWTLFRAGPKHGRSWGFMDHRGRMWPANSESMQ